MAVPYGQKSFSKFVSYLIARVLIFVLGMIPFRLRSHLCGLLGIFLGKVIQSNRRLVYENIRNAFPGETEAWVQKILRQSYYNFGRQISYFIQTRRINQKFIDRWMVINRSEPSLQECIEKGGIFILGHLGVWEWSAILLKFISKNQVYAYALRQSNPWVHDYIYKSRTKLGVKIIHTDESHKLTLKALKSGAGFGFIADQAASMNGGHLIEFMNRYAVTHGGPATMARICNVPVYFYSSYHDEKYRVHFDIQRLQLPDIDPKTNSSLWEKIFTHNWVKLLEQQIKLHPADYFWMHNRWKKNYNDEELIQARSFWQSYEK